MYIQDQGSKQDRGSKAPLASTCHHHHIKSTLEAYLWFQCLKRWVSSENAVKGEIYQLNGGMAKVVEFLWVDEAEESSVRSGRDGLSGGPQVRPKAGEIVALVTKKFQVSTRCRNSKTVTCTFPRNFSKFIFNKNTNFVFTSDPTNSDIFWSLPIANLKKF